MDNYTATEQAYKNGYEQGYEQGKKDAVKWISVEERLPEDKNEVMVFTTKKVSKARFYDGRWHGSGGCWMNVTHWMPLPEPPMDGGNVDG